MNIIKNSVVTLNYRVTNPEGAEVDDGKEPLIYLHGGHDDLFPKLEEALDGKTIGDTVTVRLHADEAFGEYDPELVQIEPLDNLPEEIQVGMELEGEATDEEDDDEVIVYRVTEINGDEATLDGNHPLAGQALVFTCTVAAVRPATAEELANGTAESED
ncbi:peptidylprolyl isomerase [Zoogloea sp.]|uniref:FKBP-type peptidyl-prolyl cis-trans isomerase n=1 Tax=Zoogloea sp. TaxID=49181 RepID=UPI002604B494|nr:peptidylprolyl isomerase [Zoogloea sp.]MDD3354813.1 peptidylprolyl isomerase [Zoogloea sp.]